MKTEKIKAIMEMVNAHALVAGTFRVKIKPYPIEAKCEYIEIMSDCIHMPRGGVVKLEEASTAFINTIYTACLEWHDKENARYNSIKDKK